LFLAGNGSLKELFGKGQFNNNSKPALLVAKREVWVVSKI
jgi:hypothetical protein